jgi:hypothetical protein
LGTGNPNTQANGSKARWWRTSKGRRRKSSKIALFSEDDRNVFREWQDPLGLKIAGKERMFNTEPNKLWYTVG